MLTELDIRNLGPIHQAEVTFPAGMTAITGETGAGKSMLLNALQLVRGGQAESSRVSAGEQGTWAQAVFDVSANPAARKVAEDAGVEVSDDEVFLTRQVPQSGRSKAILNGHTVPRSVLADVSDRLITIHGQSDQLRLVSSARQRDFLDDFAQNQQLRHDFDEAWAAYSDLNARLERLGSQQAAARQRADYLRESIESIERVDPQPNEDEELKAKRDRIENSAAIMEAVGGALAALDSSQVNGSEEQPSVTTLLAQASGALQAARKLPDISEISDQLNDVSTKVSDIVYSLSSQLESVDGTDADLDTLNARIHDLGELTRRWGPTIDDVRNWLEKARFELEDVDASPEKLEELKAKRAQAYEKAMKAARTLHATRREAATSLSERVNSELSSLAMQGSKLSIAVEARSGDDALTSSGIDDVAFMFTPFPGAGAQPLGKSASGGELSRLMLALELSLADEVFAHSSSSAAPAAPMTFVFDEVDAGVGGAAAVELGKRLARLARSAQVIVVTHLAQVASWAQAQFVVRKIDDSGIQTTVTRVEDSARVREIARMLSGSDSKTSLQHATELLGASTLPGRAGTDAQKAR